MKRLILAAFFAPALAAHACAVSEPGGAANADNRDAGPSPVGSTNITDSGTPNNVGNDAGQPSAQLFAFVGSSDGKLHSYSVNETTGAWTSLNEVTAGKTPWFAAFDPAHHHVVAIDDDSATVQSFTFEANTGLLTPINSKATGGAGPVHVSFDPSGKWVFVANFGGANVTVRPIDDSGMLGDATDAKPSGAGSAWVGTDPVGSDVFVAAIDEFGGRIPQYRFDSTTGKLADNGWGDTAPGAGPRHLVIHPNRKWAYAINRNANTVASFFFDPNFAGKMWPFKDDANVSALPDNQNADGVQSAEIVIHPTGKWIYASTRGYDSIATFEVDPTTGRIKLVKNTPTEGAIPRSFGTDPEGTLLFVGNQDANAVVGFRIDPATGALTSLGKTVDIAGPSFVGLARFQ